MNNSGGIQIRLGDLLYALLKRWKLILALTFLGLVFGILLSAVSYMQGSYTNYEIEGSFALLSRDDKGYYTDYYSEYPRPADFHLGEDMVDASIFVILSDRTMNAAIDSLHMIGIKPKDITQNLTLEQYNETQIVEATLTWRNAEDGIAILKAVFDAADVALKETLSVGDVSVIDEPAAKQTLSNTLGGSVWGYMMLLGFLAGVGFVILELLMRPTLTNLNDVETVLGLEMLGTIPKDDKYFRRKKSLLVEDDVLSPSVTQNFSSTAFILRNRLANSQAPRCFYVTSTMTGEGKTIVAANLAIQLSDMEHKVLLIDMDTRNPSLGKLFLNHVDYDRSLNSLYRGEAVREEAIFTLTGYLDLLPTVIDRQPIPMDGTIFDLIKNISKDYDYVIMDAAPVGQVSEALSLNEVADTVLFVLKYDTATIPEIRSSLDKLDKSGIRILGCVVNAATNVAGAALSESMDDRMTNRRSQAPSEHMVWEKSEDENTSATEDLLPEDEKSKKKHRFFKRKAKKQTKQVQPADLDQDENKDESKSSVVRNGKNVLEELMEEEKTQENSSGPLSDSDAAEALFKYGFEGKWETEQEQSAPVIPEEAPETGEALENEDPETEEAPGNPETVENPETEEAPANPEAVENPHAEEPAEISEEPAEISEEPAEISEEPAEISEEPAETSEEPAETSEEPAEVSEEPAETSEEPAEISEEPAETPEEPTEIPEEPAETPEESIETSEDQKETGLEENPEELSESGEEQIRAIMKSLEEETASIENRQKQKKSKKKRKK